MQNIALTKSTHRDSSPHESHRATIQSSTKHDALFYFFFPFLRLYIKRDRCGWDLFAINTRVYAQTCVVEAWQIVSTLIAPEFDANRSSNFKLRLRSLLQLLRSREMRRGEQQCHSESHVSATLQHLVLYLINCDMNSVHDFISLFSRYRCGSQILSQGDKQSFNIFSKDLSFLFLKLYFETRCTKCFLLPSFFSACIYTCNL